MTKFHIKSFLASLVLFIGNIVSSNVHAADVVPLMHQNYQTVIELQKYTADPKKFNDPANQQEIKNLIDRLASVTHFLPAELEKDRPGMVVISQVFANYLGDIRRNLKAGDKAYLRNKIRTATSFCMECHTSLSTTQSFVDVQKSVDASALPLFEKAQFFAATRQFDKALAAYSELFSHSPADENEGRDIQRAVRSALNISVRVKQDPKVTQKILDRVKKLKGLPEIFQEDVTQWQKDVSSWVKDKPRPHDVTAGAIIRQAGVLMDQARVVQKYPADPAADISYLRATNALQEALTRSPTKAELAQAYSLLGTAYSVLQDPLLWDLGDFYYEACIREQPHTDVAGQCYKKFSDEVRFGYTGSGGVDLPKEDAERLSELRKLAR